jgi:hypothetical protein
LGKALQPALHAVATQRLFNYRSVTVAIKNQAFLEKVRSRRFTQFSSVCHPLCVTEPNIPRQAEPFGLLKNEKLFCAQKKWNMEHLSVSNTS